MDIEQSTSVSFGPEPSVYAFLKIRDYFEAWLEWKRIHRPRFTVNALCRRAGVSAATVSNFRRGDRNLGRQACEKLANAIDLDEEERVFFLALRQLSAAREPLEQERILRTIVSHAGFQRAQPLKSSSLQYLTSWVWPAVHELARRSDFQDDPDWIRAQLSLKAPREEIVAVLAGLKSLGLLVCTDGETVVADEPVVTRHDAVGAEVYAYQRMTLEVAERALYEITPALRQFGAATLLVPAARLEEVRRLSRQFFEAVLALSQETCGPDGQVLQLNVQLFPLSKEHDKKHEPAP